MRTRLSYLAIILLPLVVYSTALLNEFATPADLSQMQAATRGAEMGRVREGILPDAMLSISFTLVKQVEDLRWVRGLSILLLVLCGLAVWQTLERAGWSEFDATVLSLGVLLLPAAQLAAGWATAWPGTLGSLLSLAGFAAAESELEQGGGRRAVAMIGGVLLYLGAAWCYFPSAVMALVPLGALALTRPARLVEGTRHWFSAHVALLLAAMVLAWGIERIIMRNVDLLGSSPIGQRVVDLVTCVLPLSFAPFIAANAGTMRVMMSVLGALVLVAVVYGARMQAARDARRGATWRLVAAGSVLVFAVNVALAPDWEATYRTLWPMAGVVVACAIVVVRGFTAQPGGRSWWHHAALSGFVAIGAVAAFGQLHRGIVQPLSDEWHAVRTIVARAHYPLEAKVRLIVQPNASAGDRAPATHFGVSVAEDCSASRGLFESALKDRFPSGWPRKQCFDVEVARAGAVAPASGEQVIDLTRLH